MTAARTYHDELLHALRVRDVPGPRIAEALAEVDSHVAETGESPVDAFGPAGEYADRLAAALGGAGRVPWGTWDTLRAAGVGVGSFLATWLLLDGVVAAVRTERAVAGLPPAPAILLGVATLLLGGAWLLRHTRRSADRVLDPRTGQDMTPPTPRWVTFLLFGVPLLGVLASVALVAVLASR